MFFSRDPHPPDVSTLSLHDALPILIDLDALDAQALGHRAADADDVELHARHAVRDVPDEELQPAPRSEEHTSELQSHHDLVCRLLLEKKKNKNPPHPHYNNPIIHHH